MKPIILVLIATCLSTFSFSQAPKISKKQTTAIRIEEPIRIDGELDEPSWLMAPLAENFIQNTPHPGNQASQETEVRLLYDNTAIYVGAKLFDNSPDSILKEMTERDNIGNTDWFAVIIDAYRDGNNGVGFVVTPSGIQFDTKYSASAGGGGFGGVLHEGETTWDAVWDSEVRIVENGWVVEMKIPYSAIRFPSMTEQTWHVNFVREVRRLREVSFWNEVNPNIEGYLNQSGEVSGVSNIKSPPRLSTTPFFAIYAENYYDKNGSPKSSWGRSINGGMDIKYGINDAFTLDMTLVPDFGQVRSDNEVLNLSPFEVRFDENRQFFTEGTELFNKGGLFYSRRVGGRPLHFFDVYDQTGDNEEITDNPRESQLINATKVSGRTNKGLGVGVFNAISAKTTATIQNTETGDRREVVTNPLTNYNIVVFDQNLKNNSYLTFINTNVMRSGKDYDANVSGTRFNFRNKAQSYAFNGKVVVNQKYYTDSTDLGHAFFGELSKTSGKFQWEIGYNQESYDYDPNDLGFIFNPNEKSWFGGLNFDQNKPFGKFIEAHVNMDMYYSRLHKPDVFQEAGFGFEGWMLTNKRFAFGLFNWFVPVETFDYFEPRTEDISRHYRIPTNFNFGGWVSTDYRKKFALDVNLNYRKFNEDGRIRYNIRFSPRLRVNDRLSFSLSTGSFNAKNDVGYVTTLSEDEIIFGVRDNITVENIFNTTYIFSNKMSLSFRLRHYWSKAAYSRFGLLDESGRLTSTTFDKFSDNNFNAFTIDAVYRWRFAPGSDIFIVWKNNTSGFSNQQEEIQYSYSKALERLHDFPQSNSLSVKAIYYLDYLELRKS
jgi:hypothetical protein